MGKGDVDKESKLSNLSQIHMRIDYLNQCITFEPVMDAHLVTIENYFENLASTLHKLNGMVFRQQNLGLDQYIKLSEKVKLTMQEEHQERLLRPSVINEIKKRQELEEKERLEEERAIRELELIEQQRAEQEEAELRAKKEQEEKDRIQKIKEDRDNFNFTYAKFGFELGDDETYEDGMKRINEKKSEEEKKRKGAEQEEAELRAKKEQEEK